MAMVLEWSDSDEGAAVDLEELDDLIEVGQERTLAQSEDNYIPFMDEEIDEELPIYGSRAGQFADLFEVDQQRCVGCDQHCS